MGEAHPENQDIQEYKAGERSKYCDATDARNQSVVNMMAIERRNNPSPDSKVPDTPSERK